MFLNDCVKKAVTKIENPGYKLNRDFLFNLLKGSPLTTLTVATIKKDRYGG